MLDACTTPRLLCGAAGRRYDAASGVTSICLCSAARALHWGHGVRAWVAAAFLPSQCPACALEEEERSETSGASSDRLGRPQSSTYGRHVSVWGMSWVAGSHAVVLSAVSAVEERSRI